MSYNRQRPWTKDTIKMAVGLFSLVFFYGAFSWALGALAHGSAAAIGGPVLTGAKTGLLGKTIAPAKFTAMIPKF